MRKQCAKHKVAVKQTYNLKGIIGASILLLTTLSITQQNVYAASDRIVAQAGTAMLKQSELDNMIAQQIFDSKVHLYELGNETIASWQQEQIFLQQSKKKGVDTLDALKKSADAKFPSVNKTRIQKAAAFLNEEELSVLVEMLNQVRDEKNEQSIQESIEQLLTSYTTQSWLNPPVTPQSLRHEVQGQMDLSRGNINAPVQLVVFSDFSCFYCGEFVEMIQPLVTRYPENLNIVFRHAPYSNEAILASEASQCAADQQHFWDYHDALFATQDLSADNLKAIAFNLHLDRK